MALPPLHKYVLIIGDGMADYPVPELGGKTPLSAANKPTLDAMAREGEVGLFRTLFDDIEMKGTDVAHLSIFGFDPHSHYPGRGTMEAAAMGIELSIKDVALRMNLITVENGKIVDYCAGHITNEEAQELVLAMKNGFGTDGIEFYPGVQYRHILVLRNGYSDAIKTCPPHENVGKDVNSLRIEARLGSDEKAEKTAKLLNAIVDGSLEVLSKHPVNIRRKKENMNEANSVWFWGQGSPKGFRTFKEKHGVSAALITAVDVVKGLGALLGMQYIPVKGATGYYDTDYDAKADAAIEALKVFDFVVIHVEAPDEAGHTGNVKEKVRAIENISERIARPVKESLDKSHASYSIAVMPDHITALTTQQHEIDPVPVLIYRKNGRKSGLSYNEEDAKKGTRIKRFMEYFMRTVTEI